MTISLALRSVAIADLRLVGLEYVASMEGCDCDACRAFDREHDADILAREHGRPVIVAYRRQDDYDYPTITTRLTTDRGCGRSQAHKIMEGISLADYHLQGYPTRVMWVDAASLQTALRHPPLLPCTAHSRTERIGSGGQTFIIVCAECCRNLHETRRLPVAVSA